jgi:trehalose 6-phosphate synthase
MFIVSNVPPAIEPKTGHLNVYGGLAVAVIDSIPPQGAIWAGIVTDPKDTAPHDDTEHRVRRLPILVDDKTKYLAHYAPWCKGKIYAAFHSLLEYAGLHGERFAEPAEQTERNYQAHLDTIADFGKKLAREVRAEEQKTGLESVMIHDYQLIELGKTLRAEGLKDNNIGIYLHIPFPPPEDFCKIPHAREIFETFLAYNLVGFQEMEYSGRNFIATAKALLPEAVFDPRTGVLEAGGKRLALQGFAASINPVDTLTHAINGADSPAVSDILGKAGERRIVLSAARFDIIKGIPQALKAVEELLDETPRLGHECFFVFNLQTTKYDGLTCYEEYQRESLEIAERIRDKHPHAFHLLNGLGRVDMLGLMRHADIMHVSTLIEGQNLMTKEFVIAHDGADKHGIAILSKGCGAYHGLKDTGGIFIHNPHDVGDHKESLRRALTMPEQEARAIQLAQQNAVHAWTSQHYGHGLTEALHSPLPTPPEGNDNAPAGDLKKRFARKNHRQP